MTVVLFPPKAKELERTTSGAIGPGARRDVIQVALRILRLAVDRRGDEALRDGQDRDDRLQGAGRAQGVAVHRFRRTDGNPPGPRAEDLLDRPRLHEVVGRRRRAVGVDVIDRLRLQSGVRQGLPHRPDRPGGADIRRGHVVRIAGHAVAQHLGQDRAPLFFGPAKGFQDQDPRRLARG